MSLRLAIATTLFAAAATRAFGQAPPPPPPPHPNDPHCHLWPTSGLVCRGDPVGVRICPRSAQLIWSDGHTSPAARDGHGGYVLGVTRQPGRRCPDGSRPIPTTAPIDTPPGQGPS